MQIFSLQGFHRYGRTLSWVFVRRTEAMEKMPPAVEASWCLRGALEAQLSVRQWGSKRLRHRRLPERMLAFERAQFDGILKKNSEFNNTLLSNQEKQHLSTSEIDVSRIGAIIKVLKDTSHYHSSRFSDDAVTLVLNLLKSWEIGMLFPVIDLMRMIVLHPVGSSILFKHVSDGNVMLFY